MAILIRRYPSSLRSIMDTWSCRGTIVPCHARVLVESHGRHGMVTAMHRGFPNSLHAYHSMLVCTFTSSSSSSSSVVSRRRSWVVSASREVSNQRQPKLSNAEKKVLRQKAQRMQDGLVTVNAGDKGLTVNFLSGLFDALKANQLVKVRMGCSREEKKGKTEELENMLDCVCVHSIGSVVILFRQKGLSMPDALVALLREGGDEEKEEENVQHQEDDDDDDGRKRIPDEFRVI